MTDQHEPDLPGLDQGDLSPNDADREGAGGTGSDAAEESGAGYGNHGQPGLEGEPGDTSRDGG